MANKKISELDQTSALQSTDLMAVVQENQGNTENPLETRKTTVGALKSAIVPSFQSGDGSLTVTEQGNQVDLRVANNNVAAGYVEDFPLSMAEGGQNVPVGFYGVRFTPGQNFIAKHAQICKRDNMTSGTFVVAIYSAGTTATGGRTEDMTLLAQTTQTSMSGNGIGTADFPESQQVELEADHEYYMVVYVQHPSSGTRGLICRKQNGNEWGNSNLTLAFSGNSQTVMETLGSSNFSTLFPSTGVNSMVLPYMKIYGDYVSMGSSSVGQQPSAQVLVITDNNVCQYLTQIEGESAETDVYLNLPEEGDETFAFLDQMHEIAGRYYDGADNILIAGESTSQYDLKKTFARDNLVVSIVSILAVLAVLLFTFLSAGMPVLLILVIQGAIWINFSFPTLQNTYLFFMGYLIVSSIQMGANIDYAIVISGRYTELRKMMSKKDACIETLNFAFPTIITSGSMMVLSGFAIGNLSSDATICGIGQCLGRGTLISIALVMFVLPQILMVGEKIIERTSFEVSVPIKLDRGFGTVRVDGMVRGQINGYVVGEMHALVKGDIAAVVTMGGMQELPKDAPDGSKLSGEVEK